MTRKSVCLVLPERTSACSYYRGVLPHRHCVKPLAERGIDLVIPDDWSSPGDHDAYVFYRTIGPRAWPLVSRLWMQGKAIAWDHDDNLWKLPEWNPNYPAFTEEYRNILDQCVHVSDRFAVTTAVLAEFMGEVAPGKPTAVLPNLIDADDFPDPRPRNDGKVRVLWAGSGYHEADLRVIVPALRAARKRFGDKIELVFAGYCPDFILDDPAIDATYTHGWPVGQHGRNLVMLAPDIGLCPLSQEPGDLPFNRCKSPVKHFEYAAAGAYTLATDGFPYGCVVDDRLSLASDSRRWEWVLSDAIDLALTAHTTMTYLRSVGRSNVIRDHSWQADGPCQAWSDWYASLVA